MTSRDHAVSRACGRMIARFALQVEALDKLLLVYGEASAVPRWFNACLYGARHIREELEEAAPDIPHFESWYAPQREAFASDPVWRWAFTARDKEAHQRDLADHSRARFELIASYGSEPLARWRPGSLFTSIGEIVVRFRRSI